MPLGQGGTSRFTVVSLSPKICVRVRSRLSVPEFVYAQGVIMFQNELCLHNISCGFVLVDFKLRQLVSIDKTFNWLTFCDLALIFKVTGPEGVVTFQNYLFCCVTQKL